MSIFSIPQAAKAPVSSLVFATAAAFAGAAVLQVVNVFRALKNRREAVILADFDDRMLADIGLTRSDVRDAYSMPMWRDPTSLLRNRVGERHRYRKSAPFGLGGQTIESPSLVPDGFTMPPTDRPARQTV